MIKIGSLIWVMEFEIMGMVSIGFAQRKEGKIMKRLGCCVQWKKKKMYLMDDECVIVEVLNCMCIKET